MSRIHSPRIITNGLVHYVDIPNSRSYPGSGNTVFDLSKSKINGEALNGIVFNELGMEFEDSTTRVLGFSNNPTLHFLGNSPYTLDCWVKMKTQPPVSSWRRIMNREGTLPAGRDGYSLWVNTNAAFPNDVFFATERFSAGQGQSGITLRVPFSSVVNVWNNFTVTYSGSELRMYRNGSLLPGTTPDTRTMTNTTTTYRIGSSGGNGSVGADISNAKIYNRALSGEEIQNNFSALRSRFGL